MPAGPGIKFDEEEDDDDDQHTVCSIRTIGLQLKPADPGVLPKETAKDSVLSTVVSFTREGWPPRRRVDGEKESEEEDGEVTRRLFNTDAFKKISSSLSISEGCLL